MRDWIKKLDEFSGHPPDVMYWTMQGSVLLSRQEGSPEFGICRFGRCSMRNLSLVDVGFEKAAKDLKNLPTPKEAPNAEAMTLTEALIERGALAGSRAGLCGAHGP